MTGQAQQLKIDTVPDRIEEAVKALSALNPPDLAAALQRVSSIFAQDAEGLRNDWQDNQAGSVWSIAARELNSSADKIQKHWDSL